MSAAHETSWREGAPAEPRLRLHGVTKSFGAVQALKGVSFELRPGEVHALLGENGAGKSTLIKIVTGAHRPDDGTIEVEGKLVAGLTPANAQRLGIACVYQQPALFPDLTVAENIALRLEPSRALRVVSWPQRRERARELLQRIGAEIAPETEVRTLSMPGQQLVELACALGAGARILILDEPTASLTRQEVDRLFVLVRGLRAQGVAIIYISHRLEEIFALADRVTVLRDGASVGTREVRAEGGQPSLTQDELIHLMVGREMAQLYPPRLQAAGATVWSLRQLGCSLTGVYDVTLDLRAGEIVGLAGLIGAGRTELAQILFGLTPADAGEIHFKGQPVTISSPQEAVTLGIAYVPEDRRRHGVILDLPIAHNMTMAIHRQLFRWGWLKGQAEERLAQEFMQNLGIKAEGVQAPGRSLSGGNQQKVALARWLATKPRLLILDEPTQGVDVGAKGEIHKIIRRLAGEGLAVLMISSDLPEILGMSDRIAVMRGGTLTGLLPGGCAAHEVMSAALGQAGRAS